MKQADEPRRVLHVQPKTWNQFTGDWAAANIYQQYWLPPRLLFSASGCSRDEAQDHQTLFLLRCYSNMASSASRLLQAPHTTTTTQHNTTHRIGTNPLQPDLWRNWSLVCGAIKIIIRRYERNDVTANCCITRTLAFINNSFPSLMSSSQSSLLIWWSDYVLNI